MTDMMHTVATTQTLQIQLTANKMDKQTKEETTKEKGSPRRSSTRGSKCSGPVKAVGQNVLKWKYLRTQNIRPHSFILLTHRFANFAVRPRKLQMRGPRHMGGTPPVRLLLATPGAKRGPLRSLRTPSLPTLSGPSH